MAELTFKTNIRRDKYALDEETARVHDPCNSEPGTGAYP